VHRAIDPLNSEISLDMPRKTAARDYPPSGYVVRPFAMLGSYLEPAAGYRTTD
jgi:hypothetical protein